MKVTHRRLEMQDEKGQPLRGFALADGPRIFGDTVERWVTGAKGSDVGLLAGRTGRLRFGLKDADLFSFRFAE